MPQVTVQPHAQAYPYDDTHLLDADNAELIHTIQFDENQIYVEMIYFFGISLLVMVCTFGFGIIMPFFAFVPYLRFYYLFKHRYCYVTAAHIVLKQEEPNMCGCWWPSRSELHVPLFAVVNVSLTQSFVQRWFDTWTVNVQTPGQGVMVNTADGGGSLGPYHMQLVGVRDPQVIRKIILQCSKHAKENGTASSNLANQDSAIIDIRNVLKDIKTMM